MSKKSSGKFDQNKYVASWKKENMKYVSGAYKNEFVDKFKVACKKLDLKQSDIIRKAMQEVIEKAEGK